LYNKLSIIIEINSEKDHIHFILSVRPTSFNIFTIINIFKSSSSMVVRDEYTGILNVYYGKNVKFWSRSYFVSSVGKVSLKTLIHYIENQDRKTDSSTTCRG
jgi:putative transposase